MKVWSMEVREGGVLILGWLMFGAKLVDNGSLLRQLISPLPTFKDTSPS